jgi:hypothetical protein
MPELGLTSFERQHLLDRFGIFRVRLASTILRRGPVTATDLARDLAERSGLEELQGVLHSLFFTRRDVLKSRSALLALSDLAHEQPLPGSQAVASEIEEIIASAHPFNELRVLSAVRAGWVAGKPAVLEDLERVIGGTGTSRAQRLGLQPDATAAEELAAAVAALDRWQRRAENPMTVHELVVAARVAVRSCEGMLAELAASR